MPGECWLRALSKRILMEVSHVESNKKNTFFQEVVTFRDRIVCRLYGVRTFMRGPYEQISGRSTPSL